MALEQGGGAAAAEGEGHQATFTVPADPSQNAFAVGAPFDLVVEPRFAAVSEDERLQAVVGVIGEASRGAFAEVRDEEFEVVRRVGVVGADATAVGEVRAIGTEAQAALGAGGQPVELARLAGRDLDQSHLLRFRFQVGALRAVGGVGDPGPVGMKREVIAPAVVLVVEDAE